MQYSTNYNMNKPELAEQYRLSHWNENTDIIDGALQAIRSGADEVMKATLLNFCYPIGSLYWSSKSTDPSTLFGGTWTQIKDRFVWAKGDNDTVNATGGAKTVTLTVNQIPSHTHTFTGSEVTTGGSSATNTGSESSHTHSYSHTHGYTPSGKIASTSGGTDNKTASESSHTHNMEHYHSKGTMNIQGTARSLRVNDEISPTGAFTKNDFANNSIGNSGSHYWQWATLKFNASNSGAWTGKTSGSLANNTSGDSTPKTSTGAGSAHSHTAYFTGSAGTTTSQSSTTTGAGSSHSHTMAHTHKVTASGTNGNTGGGKAHENMPPYIVKYCWERTA